MATARSSAAAASVPSATGVKHEALVAQKRAAIAGACVPLFHSQGYHATTTRQIAAAAGMTMGGLYLYIREKSDCLRFILDSIHEDVVALGTVADDLPADEALRRVVVDIIEGVHRHRREILVLDQARDVLLATAPAEAVGYEQHVVQRIEQLLRRGTADGVFGDDADPWQTALAIFWQCGLWVYRYERLRARGDVSAFAQRQADLLLGGLLRRD